MSLIDFKMFLGKQLKNGSVILAMILPIVLVLGQFNLIRKDYMTVLNQVLIGAEVIIVVYKIIFDEFLKSKTKLRRLNEELSTGNFTQAEEIMKENNLNETVNFAIKTTKDLIETAKTKQNSTDENLSDQNLAEQLAEARKEGIEVGVIGAIALIPENKEKVLNLFPT